MENKWCILFLSIVLLVGCINPSDGKAINILTDSAGGGGSSPQPTAKPDIIISKIEYPQPVLGQPTTYSVYVKNRGTKTYFGNLGADCNYFFDNPDRDDTQIASLPAQFTSQNIPVGTEKLLRTCQFNLVVEGSYLMSAKAISNPAVDELSITNNTRQVTFTILESTKTSTGCGNNIVEAQTRPPEQCECRCTRPTGPCDCTGLSVADLNFSSCESFGFTDGNLSCFPPGSRDPDACTYNTTGCYTCGNKVCEPNENNQTCPNDCGTPQQITIVDGKGYPYDPAQMGDFAFLADFNYSIDGNFVTGISIANDTRQWKDEGIGAQVKPPLYMPQQALTPEGHNGTNTAVFLDNAQEGTPGAGLFYYRFDGFSQQTTTAIHIGSFPVGSGSGINFADAQGIVHNVPYWIPIVKSGNSSFVFDTRTIYFAATTTDATVTGPNGPQQYDGNAVFSMAPLYASALSDYLVHAGNGIPTLYYTNGTTTTDPAFLSLRGKNDVLFRYKVYAQSGDGGLLFLMLDAPQIFNGLYDGDIRFLGTDTSEDGTIDRMYYAPNRPELGGGVSGNYFVAAFEIETGGDYINGAEANADDYDTQVFINTFDGTTILTPNTGLSFYTYPIRYNRSLQDGRVRFDLDNTLATPVVPKTAYTDYGALIDANRGAYIEIPENARHGRLSIRAPATTGEQHYDFTTSEMGTGDFNSQPGSTPEVNSFTITGAQLPFLKTTSANIQWNGNTLQRNFSEKIEGTFNMYFDYQGHGGIADLEGEVKSNDMRYKSELGQGIPLYESQGSSQAFLSGANDNVVIPFFGRFWKVISANKQTGTILLEST